MKQLSKLFLFVHPMPRQPRMREEYLAKWEQLISTEGPDENHAVCLLSNSPKERMNDLLTLVECRFRERYIVDPCDDSSETKVLLAEDLERTFAQRGYFAEWVPLEIWTSCIARRWTEGLKKELGKRALSDPGYVPRPVPGLAPPGRRECELGSAQAALRVQPGLDAIGRFFRELL